MPPIPHRVVPRVSVPRFKTARVRTTLSGLLSSAGRGAFTFPPLPPPPPLSLAASDAAAVGKLLHSLGVDLEEGVHPASLPSAADPSATISSATNPSAPNPSTAKPCASPPLTEASASPSTGGKKKRVLTLQQRVAKLKGEDGAAALKWAKARVDQNTTVHTPTTSANLFDTFPLQCLDKLADAELIQAIDFFTLARNQYLHGMSDLANTVGK